jgi:MIP family channel proteins
MSILAAEFISAFTLVFFGAGTVAVHVMTEGNLGTAGIGLAFGMVVFTNTWLFGRISGAHANPAISLALYFHRDITFFQLWSYTLMHILGATAGAFLITYFVSPAGSAGVTLPAMHLTPVAAFLLEMLFTMILIGVILMNPPATDNESWLALSITVAGIYTVITVMGVHLTGASMNPARSIGPALASMDFDSLWIYIAGPYAGALSAVVIKRFLFGGIA